MAIRFGPIDPLQLIFSIISSLVAKRVLSTEEAESIIKDSLDPSLTDEEKEKILQSLKGPDHPENKKDVK